MADALIHIADHIRLFPTEGIAERVEPNIGVIQTAAGTVLVDAGNSPRHARRIAHALDEAGMPPVSHIIYTHHHWDHVYGAQVFPATVVAHELCRELLAERAARPWSAAYIEEEIRRNPAHEIVYTNMQRAVGNWSGFRIVLPSMTFTGALALHLGGAAIDLEYVGGQHAADSIVVKLRDSGVAFLGDCFYPPPLQPAPEPAYDRELVACLLDDASLHTFIDGHSTRVRRRDEFAQFAAT